eukprot:XP_013995565.1 PREDICTED: uncharacterized protein LOC106569101 [Salmo salar]
MFIGVSCEDLTPLKEEYCLEGTPVTLSFTKTQHKGQSYSCTSQIVEVKRLLNSRVDMSLPLKEDWTVVRDKPPYSHLTVKLNKEKTCVDLEISSVEVRDFALYDCTVEPTMTGKRESHETEKHKLYFCSLFSLCQITLTSMLPGYILIYALVGGSHGNDITPTTDKVFGLEGDVINLSCNYSSARTLQWYRQYPGSSPTFLLLITVSSTPSVVNATPPYPRLSVELNDERTRVELEISSAVVTDSALYYCVLEPTMTGNPETLTLVRAKPPYSHLPVKLNKEKTCVDLEISSVEVRDCSVRLCCAHIDMKLRNTVQKPYNTALYCCAVTSTVTHNLLTQQ